MRATVATGLLGLLACSGDRSTTPSASLSLAASSGISVAAGLTSAPIVLTLSRVNTTTPVTLIVEGLPTGVTATVNPSTLPAGVNSATLTLVTVATATEGSSSITVRASGGGLDAQVAIGLLVQPKPDYTVSIDSSSFTIPTNSLHMSNVNVVPNQSFTGTVQFSFGPLPEGVSGNVAPPFQQGGPSRLQFGVAPTTTPGTYPITLTAQAANVAAKVITINVNVVRIGAISASVTPNLLAIVHGETTNVTVTVTRTPPFTGPVTLTPPPTGNALQFGMSRTVIPANESTATLTITVAPAAGSGTPVIAVGVVGIGVGPVNATLAVATIPVPNKWLTLAALDTIRVAAGSTTTLNARVVRNPAFTAAITYAVVEPVPGVTISFAPNPVLNNSVGIQIVVSPSTAPGVYLLQWSETAAADVTGVAYFLRVLPSGSIVAGSPMRRP